ncbi:Fe-S cluster assembly protein SufB [Patescibacteria group bacterium]|nr:Fe-S cluster assembly protein SufB [Patescibacteria group bacterium]
MNNEFLSSLNTNKTQGGNDQPNPERLLFKSLPGISEDLVRKISEDKSEPEWMLQKRLESLQIFKEMKMPNFGPSLKDLNLNEIHLFLKPDSKKNLTSWEEIPTEIRQVYENLGIPEAEKKTLGGVGAQYESEMLYHNLKKDLENQGIIFINCDEGLKKYPDLFKKYFMTECVSPKSHKFAALHGAFWSGGTFIYVPKGVKVEFPLQAYFRMNSKNSGQFEHTLIIADENSEVHYIEGCSSPNYEDKSSGLHSGCVEIYVLKGAKVRYSSLENWSKNTYNLNTKKAVVYENGKIEWINSNLGSKVTMLYPCSILLEKGAKVDYLGITYASTNQNQDTGCKVYHLAPDTNSHVVSKSLSSGGGTTSYRGFVNLKKGCKNSKSSVTCEGLMLDDKSKIKTFPSMEVEEKDVKVSHEATVGKIGEEEIFYLTSRGLPKKDAINLLVSGFIEPLIKELPIEYAIEINRLIELEIENSSI